MACLSYTTPAMVNNDWNSIKTFVDTMNTNMISAGLIRSSITSGLTVGDSFGTKNLVDYNTNTFTTMMGSITPTSSSSVWSEQYLFSLQYDLPVGDGSIVTDVHPSDSRYRKVITESYDPTPIRIRLDFVWKNLYSVANTTISNRVIVVQLRIIEPITNVILYSAGVGYNLVSNNFSTSNILSFSGNSYIALTGRTLSLKVGKHTIINSPYANNNNEYFAYMINIDIHRNNGKICIYGIPSGVLGSGYTPYGYYQSNSSSMQMTTIDTSNNYIVSYNNINNNFLLWAHGTTIPSMSGGDLITGKVYGIYGINTIMQHSQFVVTRKVDAAESTVLLLYKYRNELVLGNFLNIGLSDRSICPVAAQSKTYSWAHLYDTDAVYTTNHVGI